MVGRSFRTATMVVALSAVSGCGGAHPSQSPAGGLASAAPSIAVSPSPTMRATALPTGIGEPVPDELVLTRSPQWAFSIGVPATWTVLNAQNLAEMINSLGGADPSLLEGSMLSDYGELKAFDLDGLPDHLALLDTFYGCGSTAGGSADLLAHLQGFGPGPAVLVSTSAGEAAKLSYPGALGRYTVETTVFAWSAPSTDCDGTLDVFVHETDPVAGLANAIAQSVVLGSSGGTVGITLRGAITTDGFAVAVACESGGEDHQSLNIAGQSATTALTVQLEIDATGQPVLFSLAANGFSYISGKGWDAAAALHPEAGTTQARGAATFEGIQPADGPAAPLSGRVEWECPG